MEFEIFLITTKIFSYVLLLLISFSQPRSPAPPKLLLTSFFLLLPTGKLFSCFNPCFLKVSKILEFLRGFSSFPLSIFLLTLLFFFSVFYFKIMFFICQSSKQQKLFNFLKFPLARSPRTTWWKNIYYFSTCNLVYVTFHTTTTSW